MVDFSDKPAPTQRTALIAWRLGKMAELHDALKDEFDDADVATLARQHRYVRLRGESVRPVSLHPDTPLGELVVNGKVFGEVSNVAGLKALLKSDLEAPGPTRAPTDRDVGEERLLQCFLIREVLQSGRWLHPLMPGLADHGIDELKFVCDELNIGIGARMPDGSEKVTRGDIIALGRRGATWFPVFIELKYDRHLKRLLEQLQAIQCELLAGGVADAFRRLLATVAGVDETTIDMTASRKMLVWPRTQSGQEAKATVTQLAAQNIIAVTYTSEPESFHFQCPAPLT
jgi:hypothetical protein